MAYLKMITLEKAQDAVFFFPERFWKWEQIYFDALWSWSMLIPRLLHFLLTSHHGLERKNSTQTAVLTTREIGDSAPPLRSEISNSPEGAAQKNVVAYRRFVGSSKGLEVCMELIPKKLHQRFNDVPSSKRLHNYRKSSSLRGKSTINGLFQ